MADRTYYWTDGNPIALDTLCRREPEWAANRIRTDDDELAALRARVAELEAHRDAAHARTERALATLGEANKTADMLLTQRDAMFNEIDRLTGLLRSAHASRTLTVEAERAPKVRDEGVPPPGFVATGTRGCRREDWNSTWTIAKAWAQYDAEHGYAPDLAVARECGPCQFCDAANVLSHEGLGMPTGHVFVPGQGWALIEEMDAIALARADERAQCEREIVAFAHDYARACRDASSDVADGEARYLRGRARGAEDIAQRIDEGVYPRLPRSTEAPPEEPPC